MKLQLLADDDRGSPLGTAFTETDTPDEDELQEALDEIAKQATPILEERKEVAEAHARALAGEPAEEETPAPTETKTETKAETKIATGATSSRSR
jgi:hypothetical protein